MNQTDIRTNLAAIKFIIELRHQQQVEALAILEKSLLLNADGLPEQQSPLPARPAKESMKSPPRKPRKASCKFKPQVLEAARALLQPFTTDDLADAMGFAKKDASNFFQRWRHKGWIAAESFGKWYRTATFGIKDTSNEYGQVLLQSIHAEIAAKVQKTHQSSDE